MTITPSTVAAAAQQRQSIRSQVGAKQQPATSLRASKREATGQNMHPDMAQNNMPDSSTILLERRYQIKKGLVSLLFFKTIILTPVFSWKWSNAETWYTRIQIFGSMTQWKQSHQFFSYMILSLAFQLFLEWTHKCGTFVHSFIWDGSGHLVPACWMKQYNLHPE